MRFTYNIKNLESVSIDLSQAASPMALPQSPLGDAANVLVKAEGNTMRISVSWLLHDSDISVVSDQIQSWNAGGDIITVTNSTAGGFLQAKYGGSVDTADEQARFLTEEMQCKGVEFRYRLVIGDTNISRFGLIEKLTLQKSGSTPITWKASIQFVAGEVVTIGTA
tara:strand:- start:191 stop:688 length:498 start_codon:yes stop_codon:yes gene_type:complete